MRDRDERQPALPVRVTVWSPRPAAVVSLLTIFGLAHLPASLEDSPASREVLGSHPGMIKILAFSPDGRDLAAGGSDGSVSLWDVATRRCILRMPPKASETLGLALEPDLSAVAIGSLSAGVSVFDLTTRGATFAFPAEVRSYHGLAYSPDGRDFAVGRADGTVALYSDAGHEKAVLGRTPRDVGVVAFSPDGRTLAAADLDGTVAVWDLATRRRTACFHGSSRPINGLEFTLDGRSIITWSACCPDSRLTDLETGRVGAVVPGLEKPYGALAFAPDGRTLAVAQLDRSILLWDVAAGRRLCELQGHVGQIWALAFSPDGHRLASGGNDMTVHLWDVPSVASH